jgi:hypothetical protein
MFLPPLLFVLLAFDFFLAYYFLFGVLLEGGEGRGGQTGW